MKFLLLLPIMILSGCATQGVPIAPKFPEATPELLKKCEQLMTIEGDRVPITELLKTIVHNYTLYYQCSNKVDGWQEWYDKQKKLYETVKQ